MSVRLIKTKTAETKIAKLGTGTVHHDTLSTMQLILGQKVKDQRHRVTKCKKFDLLRNKKIHKRLGLGPVFNVTVKLLRYVLKGRREYRVPSL